MARGGELDGRRSSALGHGPLQGRVDGAVVAETAYHDGRACQAAGPDGVTKRTRLVGICWAAISAPSFGFKSWAKSSGKNCGSTMKKGNDGAGTSGPETPRRVTDAQVGDRLTAVRDVRRRVDQSADVGRPLAALVITNPP